MKHSQAKSRDHETFLRRSDALAAAKRKNLEELAVDMGFSRASFWGYRTGKRPISAKAWRELEQSEKEAGIAYDETLAATTELNLATSRISEQETKDLNAEIFEHYVRPIYQAPDEESMWEHHQLMIKAAKDHSNDLWITLAIITLQEIRRRREAEAQRQATEILSKTS